MNERLLTMEELKDRLNISLMSVHRLRAKGMPTIKMGALVRFDWEKVQEWLAGTSKI